MKRGAVTGPPVPPEHGSWALLLAGFILGTAASPSPAAASGGLCLALIVSAHFLRASLNNALSRRPYPGVRLWAALWLTVSGSAAAALVWIAGPRFLWTIPPALVGAATLALLPRIRARKRLDRTLFGEALATWVAGIAAPFAYFVGTGADGSRALSLWIVQCAIGASGVFHVRMLLCAGRMRGVANEELRRRCGRGNLLYHAGMGIAMIAALRLAPIPFALCLMIGVAPLVARALLGWRRLGPRMPDFIRVGIGESLYAVWCASLSAAAFRAF